MKNYLSPELKIQTYSPEEAVAAELEGSKTYNDGELEW